jgi:hypothetical protein
MFASDIVKAKQNGTLYKAYYNPTVYASTVYSTICPVSSITTGPDMYVSSVISSVNTIDTYVCNTPVISYQLANDINSGSYVCGNKKISELQWKANVNNPTENIYAFQTYSTITENASVILSVNNHAVRPLICTDNTIIQGTNFASKCEKCNGVECNNCI